MFIIKRIGSIALALMVMVPVLMRAQFSFTTNNGALTITKYTGSSADVTIPSTTNGLSVVSIGDFAFNSSYSLTNIIIADGVTNIGIYSFGWCTNLISVRISTNVNCIQDSTFNHCFNITSVRLPPAVTNIMRYAFSDCTSLTNVTLSDSVMIIGEGAFYECSSLTSVTIPNSATNIGDYLFQGCTALTAITLPEGLASIGNYMFRFCSSLTNVTIPKKVTNIGAWAFLGCSSLTAAYFLGDAPSPDTDAFWLDNNATAYYLPGTTGWGSTFGGLPTALWSLPYPLILNSSFGVVSNQFSFVISWATNAPVVVEVSAGLAHPLWSSLKTNTLINGSCLFGDSAWSNYPTRFYRVRSP